MALHFAHEGSVGAGEFKGSGIVSRANNEGPGKELADFFVQGVDRFEVNGLIDVVMQMDKEGMHQCLFDSVHLLSSL
jgi:hypothetical protein